MMLHRVTDGHARVGQDRGVSPDNLLPRSAPRRPGPLAPALINTLARACIAAVTARTVVTAHHEQHHQRAGQHEQAEEDRLGTGTPANPSPRIRVASAIAYSGRCSRFMARLLVGTSKLRPRGVVACRASGHGRGGRRACFRPAQRWPAPSPDRPRYPAETSLAEAGRAEAPAVPAFRRPVGGLSRGRGYPPGVGTDAKGWGATGPYPRWARRTSVVGAGGPPSTSRS